MAYGDSIVGTAWLEAGTGGGADGPRGERHGNSRTQLPAIPATCVAPPSRRNVSSCSSAQRRAPSREGVADEVRPGTQPQDGQILRPHDSRQYDAVLLLAERKAQQTGRACLDRLRPSTLSPVDLVTLARSPTDPRANSSASFRRPAVRHRSRYVTGSTSFRSPAVRHRVRRASHRQNRQNPRGGSGRFAAEATAGASGSLGAGRGAIGEARGPELLRANPAQLLEALERALHDPGLHPRPGRGHRGVVWAGDYFTMRR